MEIRDRFDAFVEILQVEFFVGGMEVVAIQPKTHEDDLDAQLLFEKRADGDAAAAADGDGRLMEDGSDGFCR